MNSFVRPHTEVTCLGDGVEPKPCELLFLLLPQWRGIVIGVTAAVSAYYWLAVARAMNGDEEIPTATSRLYLMNEETRWEERRRIM